MSCTCHFMSLKRDFPHPTEGEGRARLVFLRNLYASICKATLILMISSFQANLLVTSSPSGTVEVEPAPPPIGPSHSRSIGEIASLLPASKPPSKDDAYRGPADSQEKAKHFWMKQQPTDRTKPSSHKDTKSKPVNTQKQRTSAVSQR